jgi:hypothetical protein
VTRGAEDLPALSLAEWAVLAVLCERDTHGWMLVRVLDHDGELGAVWTVRRALVYRSLEALEHRALITRAGSRNGRRQRAAPPLLCETCDSRFIQGGHREAQRQEPSHRDRHLD